MIDLPRATLSTPADWSFAPAPAGLRRVSSPEGGWSVVIPAAWSDMADRMRGSQLMSFVPDPRSLTSPAVPAGEVDIHIEAWPNEERLPLDQWFPKNFPLTDDPAATHQLMSKERRMIAGAPGLMTVTLEKIGPPPYGTSRIWWVASPYFDRVYKLQIWPADNPKLADVERVVGSFTMLPPTRTSVAPSVTPAAAAAAVMKADKAGNPPPWTVVSTKLIREWDWDQATRTYSYGSENDPDNLIWLVGVSGRIVVDTSGQRGPHAPPPTPAGGYTWAGYMVNAVTGGASRVEYNTSGDWSPAVSALPDRCIR